MDNPNAPVVLRRYTESSYAEALLAYEADLHRMADSGWFPVAQSWGSDPKYSSGWVFGGSSWKPGPGTLAVTYRRDPRPAADR